MLFSVKRQSFPPLKYFVSAREKTKKKKEREEENI